LLGAGRTVRRSAFGVRRSSCGVRGAGGVLETARVVGHFPTRRKLLAREKALLGCGPGWRYVKKLLHGSFGS
jgi:hypothetical protein